MAAWTAYTTGWTPGDQLMLAGTGGRTYTDDGSSVGWFNFAAQPTLGALAATYPTAILCYDPAAPADTTKYGKLIGADRPIYIAPDPAVLKADPLGNAEAILSNGTNGDGTHGGFACQGIIIDGGDYDSNGIGTQGHHDYICWQNCQFKHLELGNGSDTLVSFTINISKCSTYGMWNGTNGNTSGLFHDNIDGLWVQDCVFAHCGWKMSSSRDDAFADGGPFYLGHGNYYTAHCTNGRFDRNVYVDSASDGWGIRGNATATQLVSIDEPIVGAITGWSGDYTERPEGAVVTITDVVAMGGGDIAPNAIKAGNNLTRGSGPGGRNALLATLVNMAAFDNPKYGTPNNWVMLAEDFYSLQVLQTYVLNKIRTWNFSPIAQYRSSVPGNVGRITMTWSNSLLDGLSSKKNEGAGDVADTAVSGTGVRTWVIGDYPNRKTKDQVIAAIGFASKADMSNWMLTYSHLPWAQVFMGVGLPSLGLTPTYDTVTVSALAALMAALPAPVEIYKTTLGDLTISSLAFTRGVAKTVLLSGTSTNFLLSSSDLPAGFTIMGRALIYDGTGSEAATPTTHILETNADGIAVNTHTTPFTLNIGAGVVGTTWAAATDWTLSNGSLTANRSGTATFWGMLHASATKASGTVIHTIDAIGSAGINSVGFDTGLEANNLGSDSSGNSITYDASGAVAFGGGAVAGSPFASWTTGDVIKLVKAAGTISFYKNNVLQVTVDTTSGLYGLGSVMVGAVYPAVTTQHAAGFQATTDFSGW